MSIFCTQTFSQSDSRSLRVERPSRRLFRDLPRHSQWEPCSWRPPLPLRWSGPWTSPAKPRKALGLPASSQGSAARSKRRLLHIFPRPWQWNIPTREQQPKRSTSRAAPPGGDLQFQYAPTVVPVFIQTGGTFIEIKAYTVYLLYYCMHILLTFTGASKKKKNHICCKSSLNLEMSDTVTFRETWNCSC